MSRSSFQESVSEWVMAAFSHHAKDVNERNYRFLEEALELVQACGLTQTESHQLVDYVFSRPVGDKIQEVGGTMVTLASLCAAQDINMMDAADAELIRCWANIERIREKHRNKPRNSPLPGRINEKE